ncbi:hypothetical protein AWB75_07136 [Caballeronia catudaia]|uniref:Uncharacterized protein n=1 Tax=Caballeronia catudaia TaxID=1777136 RepID=A0A158DT83_9BURK|nr:hypothetical protein AWB75_07136 [Caballeronia catudaia]
MPAAASQTSTLADGLRAPSDSLTPSSRTFGGGEPILSGPYDPSKQEALLKAARSAGASAVGGGDDGRNGGFDWLGVAEAAAGALLGGTASDADRGGEPMFKSFTDGDGGSLLGDAQPFEYVPNDLSGDVMDLAASTQNPGYAAQMLGYDRKTFGNMIHVMKDANDLGGADNVVWHDDGSVYFREIWIDNMHNYAP